MTDVTNVQDQDGAELSAADEQLLRELTDRARTGGLQLTGEGGLLGKLTKMVVEGALEGELDDHLGYSRNDPAGQATVRAKALVITANVVTAVTGVVRSARTPMPMTASDTPR